MSKIFAALVMLLLTGSNTSARGGYCGYGCRHMTDDSATLGIAALFFIFSGYCAYLTWKAFNEKNRADLFFGAIITLTSAGSGVSILIYEYGLACSIVAMVAAFYICSKIEKALRISSLRHNSDGTNQK